jgi:hypothetical protein
MGVEAFAREVSLFEQSPPFLEFRPRFCEGLLARRVLVEEGAASAFRVACRRLAENHGFAIFAR